MKDKHAYSLRRRLNLLLHRWHRRIGITASLFLMWMAISGWLLNHTDRLHLAQRVLTSNFIATHYGIRSEIPAQVFVAGAHWLAVGDSAILDGKKISAILSQPRGMVEKNNMLFVADATTLILLDGNGELIDKIAAPIAIERIGLGCDGVVIANTDSQIATADGATFTACKDIAQWARISALSDSQLATLKPLLQSGVSLERVILDLHSGRFFGAWGPLFVDAIGLGLIGLASSGVWMFFRQRRFARRRH